MLTLERNRSVWAQTFEAELRADLAADVSADPEPEIARGDR